MSSLLIPLSLHIIDLGGVTNREKKYRRNRFVTREAIREAEYNNIKRPVNPKTQRAIEPAQKLEVTLEADHFTKEKCC